MSLLVLCLLPLAPSAHAATYTIQGKVISRIDSKPLPQIVIQFDELTMNNDWIKTGETITDSNGAFKYVTEKKLLYGLINIRIQMPNYRPLYVSSSFDPNGTTNLFRDVGTLKLKDAKNYPDGMDGDIEGRVVLSQTGQAVTGASIQIEVQSPPGSGKGWVPHSSLVQSNADGTFFIENVPFEFNTRIIVKKTGFDPVTDRRASPGKNTIQNMGTIKLSPGDERSIPYTYSERSFVYLDIKNKTAILSFSGQTAYELFRRINSPGIIENNRKTKDGGYFYCTENNTSIVPNNSFDDYECFIKEISLAKGKFQDIKGAFPTPSTQNIKSEISIQNLGESLDVSFYYNKIAEVLYKSLDVKPEVNNFAKSNWKHGKNYTCGEYPKGTDLNSTIPDYYCTFRM